MEKMIQCPCQSGKQFVQCCDQFLNQGQLAKTPAQLMRSRYSAFALGGYGDYLVSTWLPEPYQALDAVSLSVQAVQWTGLEIVNKSQQGDVGHVEFKAFFDEDGLPHLHHEKSLFKRVQGRWFYVSGIVF